MKEEDKLSIFTNTIRAIEQQYWLGRTHIESKKRVHALTSAMLKYRRQFLIYRIFEFLRLR